MDFDKTELTLKNSPSMRLLRAKNAALIVSFLFNEFKENNKITITNYVLVNRLSDYLEFIDYNDNEASKLFIDFEQRAKTYIEDWTDQGFLKKYSDEKGEHLHELTSATEKVLQWVESLEKKEFIGTESRFQDIFNKVKDLVEKSTEDPQKRIEELEKKKQEIQEEIRLIKKTKLVKSFDDYQIKSRFHEINKLSRELLSDFKEVEENFKVIIKAIYQRESNKNNSKGSILKYTFDALDTLKESDQGKSFYTFWSFLINDTSQEELKRLIEITYSLLEERNIPVEDKFLRKIKTYLHSAGRKVLENNDLLAQKLTKVIAEKDLLERKKIRETIVDIKNLALKLTDVTPSNEPYMYIEGMSDIYMPMEKKLGDKTIVVQKLDRPMPSNTNDLAQVNFSKLFSPYQIDKNLLLSRINNLLQTREQVTLKEVLEIYPITKGLAELIAYVSLTALSKKYFINDKIYDLLEFDQNNKKYLKVPQVIYSK